MTISFGDLKKGMAIELEGTPYLVVEYDRIKMQQRAPVMRLKLKDLRTVKVLEKSFQGYDVSLTQAPVQTRRCQYLYDDGDHHYFMDTENFEQIPLSQEVLGDALKYLKEEMVVDILLYNGQPLNLELPNSVDLAITDTPPGVKGDTAQGGTKPATLETGLVVQVPLFVNNGEKVKVDTRTGQYLSRAG